MTRSRRHYLLFAANSPASRASRSVLTRSRLLENAFCAISCSVIAFSALTCRNALWACRSAGVITFRSNVSSLIFFSFSSRSKSQLWAEQTMVSGYLGWRAECARCPFHSISLESVKPYRTEGIGSRFDRQKCKHFHALVAWASGRIRENLHLLIQLTNGTKVPWSGSC